MKLIKMECPYCGGSLEVKPDQKIVTCSYCGKQILLENPEKEPALHERKNIDKKIIRRNRISVVVRCLLIFFAFTGAFTGFSSERIFTGLIGLLQMGLLICTFIPYFSDKRNLNIILSVLAVCLLIPFSITLINTEYEPVKDLKWPSTSLSRRVPTPETDKGTVPYSDGKTMYAYLQRVSYDQYSSYVKACKDKGFAEYAKEDSYSYAAVDQDGYVLNLNYSSYNNEMDLKLEAPKQWRTIEWPVSPFASLLPAPDSDTGYIVQDSNTYLDIYIKDIDSKQFTQYTDAVVKKGFNTDYRSYDDYFSGKDQAGNKVYMTLNTGNIMHISLYAPE